MASNLNSEAGKELLVHASQQDYCVIQFERSESGELIIADITDHVKQLEKMAGIEDD
jgi:hypothetical protein